MDTYSSSRAFSPSIDTSRVQGATIVFDQQLIALLCNTSCNALFSFEPSEILGKSLKDIFPDASIDWAQFSAQLSHEAHTVPQSFTFTSQEGKTIQAQVAHSPVRSGLYLLEFYLEAAKKWASPVQDLLNMESLLLRFMELTLPKFGIGQALILSAPSTLHQDFLFIRHGAHIEPMSMRDKLWESWDISTWIDSIPNQRFISYPTEALDFIPEAICLSMLGKLATPSFCIQRLPRERALMIWGFESMPDMWSPNWANENPFLISLIEDTLQGHSPRASIQSIYNRYQIIAEITSDFIFELEVDHNRMVQINWVSSNARLIQHIPRDWYYTLEDLFEYIHPEDHHKGYQALAQLERGENTELIIRLLLHTQSPTSMRIHAKALIKPEPHIHMRIFGGLSNLTALKSAERIIASQEQRFRHLMEALPLYVRVTDPDGRWLYANQSLRDVLEIPEGSYLGRTSKEVFGSHAHLAPVANTSYELDMQTLARKEAQKWDMDLKLPNGQEKKWSVHRVPLIDGDTSQPHLVIVGRDVTCEREVHSELLRSESRYKALTESIQDACIAIDNAYNIEYWNKAAEALTGISRKQALKASLLDLWPQLQDSHVQSWLVEVMEQQVYQTVEDRFSFREGMDMLLLFHIYPREQGALLLIDDRTEAAAKEQLIRESEERFRLLFEYGIDGIFLVKNGLFFD
ncbi:MAG: PAS domain-containing protein, partial [Bacteroidota bacterium]